MPAPAAAKPPNPFQRPQQVHRIRGRRVTGPFRCTSRSALFEDKNMQGLIAVAIVIYGFASWMTHLVTCFTEEAWGFLIAGAIFFPVAIVHGTGVWFGIW